MAIGYLITQARTAHDAIPISGVRVSIFDDQGNSIYELITDESGETQAVPLETVDKSFSQNQYFSGIPYVSYNVLAQAAGFNSVYISDIPIFDKETATLPLNLIPMQNIQRGPNQTEIFIGSPAVAMPQMRNQEGANSIRPYVLRQVVIPNPITVHLGAPSSSASNVQVSFPDYIKNVVSSEIYPTWPEAALTANIYAIITFALNRVFTEWYRNKGYDFTITSSTAYDHKWIPNRNVFESISNVVDEIFSNYLSRPGVLQPILTQYCDGKNVTCPNWMSQWGSKSLGDRGYTAIEILRNYYGSSMYINATDVISGIPSSYPGSPLRVGDSGDKVRQIQAQLNVISDAYPLIPKIAEDGIFGPETEEAVKTFQKIFKLTQDGIVGFQTWYKISEIYVGVSRIAEGVAR